MFEKLLFNVSFETLDNVDVALKSPLKLPVLAGLIKSGALSNCVSLASCALAPIKIKREKQAKIRYFIKII